MNDMGIRRTFQVAAFQVAAFRAICCAAVLLIPAASGGEKVQIKASTSIELPKPKHTLEEVKGFRGTEGPSGRAEYEEGVAASMPVQTSSPLGEKKLKEMLDKKKNWIFVNPYQMQFDSKTEEFMEGEKATGLFNHRLMQEEKKTILEKFIDEKNPDRETDPDAIDGDPELAARKEILGLNDEQENLVERDPRDSDNRVAERADTLQFKLEQKSSFTSERTLFQQKLERTPFLERGFSDKFSEERSTLTKDDLRKERNVRDSEFNKLFPSRSFTSAGKTGFDPLNNAPDATRVEINPVGPRRSEQFLSGGRSEPSGGIAAGRNSPIFSGPASSVNLPGRSSSDAFGAKVAQPSAFTPSSSFSPPSPNRSTPSQTPFVLPFPQRKF